MEPRSVRVPALHGLSLHALAWSEDGVAFVLLHGFSNDAHVWDEFAPAVAPYYRTVAFDLPGHGDSDRDAELRYDHLAMARTVAAASSALGIERLVLVGHSMGGRVAMRFAGLHPERLAGLVIVDAGPELDARGTTRIRLDATSRRDPSVASPREYEMLLARAYPLASAETVARLARHGLRARDDGRFEPKTDPAFFRAWRDEDAAAAARRSAEETAALWDALANTPCPTLVVRGAASDVLSADVADRMADEVLAHGQLAVVPRAGHSVMIDNPEGFRDAVARFVVGED